MIGYLKNASAAAESLSKNMDAVGRSATGANSALGGFGAGDTIAGTRQLFGTSPRSGRRVAAGIAETEGRLLALHPRTQAPGGQNVATAQSTLGTAGRIGTGGGASGGSFTSTGASPFGSGIVGGPSVSPTAGAGGPGGGGPVPELTAKLLAVQQQQLSILQRIDARLDSGGARDRLEGLV